MVVAGAAGEPLPSGHNEHLKMAEFDFAGWVSRARAFTIAIDCLPGAEVRSTTVAAPVKESEMQEVERARGSGRSTWLSTAASFITVLRFLEL
jgi:hypothetical protein